MRARRTSDLSDSEYALAVPKPQVFHIRRAVAGEIIDGIWVDPNGPSMFVVLDPRLLTLSLWREDEVVAVLNLLPAPPEEPPVPPEIEPELG